MHIFEIIKRMVNLCCTTYYMIAVAYKYNVYPKALNHDNIKSRKKASEMERVEQFLGCQYL